MNVSLKGITSVVVVEVFATDTACANSALGTLPKHIMSVTRMVASGKVRLTVVEVMA